MLEEWQGHKLVDYANAWSLLNQLDMLRPDPKVPANIEPDPTLPGNCSRFDLWVEARTRFVILLKALPRVELKLLGEDDGG